MTVSQSAPRALRLAQRSSPGRYNALGTARLVNCYTEQQGADGKVDFPIVASPGLRNYLQFTNGACRGMFKIDDTLALAVYGFDIIEIQRSGAWRVAGGIPGAGPCFFARNRRPAGTEVAIVSDGQSRVYDAVAGTVSLISDPDLPPAIGCESLTSYILFFIADGRVFYSDINNAGSISSLSFFEAEGRPDGLVGGIVLENNAWLFGDESTEVWGLTEDADRPFARLGGAAIEQGCIAPASICKVQVSGATKVAWVANDKTVRMSADYRGTRISDHAVERAISALSNPEEIDSFSYTLDGHVFLVLNSSQFTWVYNATTQFWHEEQSYGLARRKWAFHMDFAGKTVVGDYRRAFAYEVSNAVFDDAGEPLVCDIITPQDHAYPNDVEYNTLYIDTVPGTGLNVSEPELADPKLAVRWSFTNANTWGPWRLLPTGKVGQHRKRVATHQLGTSQEDGAVFHIQFSPAVARAVSGAAVDSSIVRA